jgi:hypothetical protein
MLSGKLSKSIAIGATALAIGGGTYGIVSATGSNGSGSATAATAPTSVQRASHSGGSNARSGPAAGGTMGTVTSVSESSFILTTPTGQKVTVTKASAKTSVKKGGNVLVLGTVNGTTITASKVLVRATSGSAKSLAAGVVPFQQGAPSSAKQAGQIPSSYSQGSGTIVSGTAANKATEAALAAYPGGVVDRVVKLSNGEYEVHNIGVNWPHHIFVDQSFKVVGAN